jgi:membrane-bound metal-dependent hydrolase YbcI (DUF457 family)
MLPDLDSDYGTPLRETMCFTSAILPMLLLNRFASLGLKHDEMALLTVSIYLFMRFGVTNMIRKYTVHRGMFHSIPACLIFAGLGFLICGTSDLNVRYFKSGGVVLGFMSHLVLDEIYSVEWKSGRWRLKKSSGTALKFWGDDAWANFSTYAKLVVVAAMVIGEPSVMKQIQARNPQFAATYQGFHDQFENVAGGWSPERAAQALQAQIIPQANQPMPQQPPTLFQPQRYDTPTPAYQQHQPPDYTAPTSAPNDSKWSMPPQPSGPVGGEGWDTAQRPSAALAYPQ